MLHIYIEPGEYCGRCALAGRLHGFCILETLLTRPEIGV
jgi:hypothetical protein